MDIPAITLILPLSPSLYSVIFLCLCLPAMPGIWSPSTRTNQLAARLSKCRLQDKDCWSVFFKKIWIIIHSKKPTLVLRPPRKTTDLFRLYVKTTLWKGQVFTAAKVKILLYYYELMKEHRFYYCWKKKLKVPTHSDCAYRLCKSVDLFMSVVMTTIEESFSWLLKLN